MNGEPILQAKRLGRQFSRPAGLWGRQLMQAVRDVSLRLYPGETLGIVGESGCGKSTLARLLAGLDRPSSGSITLRGKPLAYPSPELPRDVQYVFQDPIASLNPRKTVRQILEAPMIHLGRLDKARREKRLLSMIEAVGLVRQHLDRYPHEFSGGQAQRIGIARALMAKPGILILDEPVSALDVSIQAQILQLLAELRAEFSLSYLFISHDLSVVESISDRVGVMYFGGLVELAEARTLFARPKHPYTELLIRSAPLIRHAAAPPADSRQSGGLPDPFAPPPGCSFADRCAYRGKRCRERVPLLSEVEQAHRCACWHPLGD